MSFPKSKPLRSTALTESANGEACTLRVMRCAYDTTVLAHMPIAGRHGMGQKPSDLEGMDCCSNCHDWLDQRTKYHDMTADDWRNVLRAVFETQERRYRSGLISVKGAK